MLSRRDFLRSAAATPLAAAQLRPDWRSLVEAYRVPDWFRDAKFGIWSHWGPQCVPEFGDWYGRQMYIQGNRVYDHHVRTYGHPSRFGFLDLIGRWRAEAWQPEALTDLFRHAGARYLMSMANHHDNFDNFDSFDHSWNSVRVGPKRDIVGTWARAARAAGLRFGVSNHSAHAWHWWQTAYGYDAEGPLKGVRYDAFRLRREHGRGTWWEGLDPQELYAGPAFVPPPGIDSIAEMNAWHDARDGRWIEHAPPQNPAFVRKWLLRQMDLVEKYRPDIVYLDDYRLPFGRIGLEAVAHYYAKSLDWHGAIDVVLTAKQLSHYQRHGIVEDVERGFLDEIRTVPWQTSTCLGQWHYDRALAERHGYKTAKEVVQRLADIVSKNGNLLLSVPQRGDGSIDEDERAILEDLARWFAVNGEAIHGTRPWRRFGEGPTQIRAGFQNEGAAPVFVGEDIRFTTKDAALYAILLDWPVAETAIRSLAGVPVERVDLLGGGPLPFSHDSEALRVRLPSRRDGGFVPVLKVMGATSPSRT
jgi:alpha-L-fucosidase